MVLQPVSLSLKDYLLCTPVIDFDSELVKNCAETFSRFRMDEIQIVEKIYTYVRDEISHSADINSQVVTCKASDVLLKREGICYAKSHLLAALLRYHDIPAGFCYQLLRLDGADSPLVLHGLNAVYIKSVQSWIRLDARGNKEGVNAQFSTSLEKLAFSVCPESGEIDYPYIYTTPDCEVVRVLETSSSLEYLWRYLPDELSVGII